MANTIDTMTPEAILRGIIDGSFSGSIESDQLTSVAMHRMRGLTGLTEFNAPNATSIGGNAFNGCSNLEDAYFPNVTTIASYAFNACSKFKAAFPAVTSNIGGNNATGAFTETGYTSLDDSNFPNVTSLSQQAFLRMPNLTHIHLKKVNSTGVGSYGHVFNGCAQLTVAVFEALGNMLGGGNHYNNTRLTVYDGYGGAISGGSVFQGCSNLITVILRRTDSVTTLANTSTFTGTPFASSGTGGTLYVPSALISSYESATNWSTILGYTNNSIQAIEGSQYENYYADGTAIE